MKTKYAFVDFCETLVDLQTADEFAEFVLKKENYSWAKICLIHILRNRWVQKICRKIIPNFKSPKPYILILLRGIPKETLNNYAKMFSELLVREFLIKDILDDVVKLKEEGYSVVIVSGGYKLYLQYFYPEIFDSVVATDIGFDKLNRCTGRIKGVDCLNENKLKKLFTILNEDDIDFENSYVFSDSITDKPLFNLAKNKIVVSKNKKQDWVNLENEVYEEKVWFN